MLDKDNISKEAYLALNSAYSSICATIGMLNVISLIDEQDDYELENLIDGISECADDLYKILMAH
jgi:hypothetical protein